MTGETMRDLLPPLIGKPGSISMLVRTTMARLVSSARRPLSRCSVPTVSEPLARADRTASPTAARDLAVKWAIRPAGSSTGTWPRVAWRTAVTRRTEASSARWQIADTGTPISLTASARSSGRYTLIFGTTAPPNGVTEGLVPQ